MSAEILRKIIRDAIRHGVDVSDSDEAFYALVRCAAYAIGAEYHVGFDQERNSAWRHDFGLVRDAIRTATTNPSVSLNTATERVTRALLAKVAS